MPGTIRDAAPHRVLDELGLDERGIAQRRAFLEITEADVARLAAARESLARLRERMVADFYDFLLGFEPVRARFEGSEQVARLRKAQTAYFDSLTAGRIDAQFVESRLRVGLAHHRAGIEPKWYVGAYRKYLSLLVRELQGDRGSDPDLLPLLESLLKLVFFDMSVVLEAYFHEGQHALDEAHAYAAQVIATRPLGIVVLDGRLRIESVNRAFCNLFGVQPADVVGLPLADDVVPVAGVSLLAREARDEGRAVRETLLRGGTEDDERHFEVSIDWLTRQGEQRGIVALKEVTARISAEESSGRLRQAVDAIDDAVLVVDPVSLRFVDANAAACRLLGYPREELLVLGPRDIHPELEDAERRERYGRLAEGELSGYAGEATYLGKDGRQVHVHIEVTGSRWQSRDFVVVVARERVADDGAALRETERLLTALATNAAGNDAMPRIVRQLEEECPGSRCAMLIAAENGPQIAQVVAPNLPPGYCSLMRGATLGPESGTCGWALFTGKPVVSTDGTEDPLWRGNPAMGDLEGVQACWSAPIPGGEGGAAGVIDAYLEERREPAERERSAMRRAAALAALEIGRGRRERQASRRREHLESEVAQRTRELDAANRELESFSYSLSHDLRAPLRAIAGFSTILAREHAGELSADARRTLERIAAASERVGVMTAEMLKLFRIGRGELLAQETDLSAIAGQVAEEIAAREPARRVSWRIAQGITVWADPGLMRIALENLLGNAWKYTSRNPSPEIEFGWAGEGAREQVAQVKDNGAGFDMAYAGRLFGLCQRLHGEHEFPGNGLGLALVRRVIERHGGRVWARAEPGRGAAFFFALPRRQAEVRNGQKSYGRK